MARWKLVPVEPTEEMGYAFSDAVQFWMEENGEDKDVYLAMLAAAPKASEDEALVDRVAEAIWKCKYGPGNRIAAERIARAVLKMLEGNHDR